MVRSLWTAATGMIAQQTNIDTIANNLANVNTNGYKTQVNEFKSLLYQTLQTKTTTANGEQKPTSAQVGLGVRNSAITSVFKTGNMISSESETAFAIDGKGFFAVRGEDGNTYYTRNGNLKFTLATNGNMLATTDGLPVLDTNGQPIILGNNYILNRITVDKLGNLCYPDANNNPQLIGRRIGVFQFNNPNGLEKQGDSLYQQQRRESLELIPSVFLLLSLFHNFPIHLRASVPEQAPAEAHLLHRIQIKGMQKNPFLRPSRVLQNFPGLIRDKGGAVKN